MLYDAHLHLNKNTDNPVQDLMDYIKKNNVAKATLILNTKEDIDYYDEIKSRLDSENLYFVFGLQDYSEVQHREESFGIKLHPKLFNMNASDITKYIEQIYEINPSVIIIDDFMYGSEVQEQLYLELIKEVANSFIDKKVVVAHAGGANLLKHVMYTKLHKNIYYDIALTVNYFRYSSIEQDICWLVQYMSNRVMLGSDYPDFTIQEAREALELYCKNIIASSNIRDVENNTYEKVFV